MGAALRAAALLGSGAAAEAPDTCAAGGGGCASAVSFRGFQLSEECEAISGDVLKEEDPFDILERCPAHCVARIAAARTPGLSRADKLKLLSPHWNSSAGDPLLTFGLADVGAMQPKACLKLVETLIVTMKDVLAEIPKTNIQAFLAMLHRQMSYMTWVLQHDPKHQLHRVFPSLSATSSSFAKPGLDLRQLPFWKLEHLDVAGSDPVAISRESDSPMVRVVDGVLTPEQCLDVIAWQDSQLRRMPQPMICIPAVQTFKNGKFWAKSDALGIGCFGKQASAKIWGRRSFPRNAYVREGFEAFGDAFSSDVSEPLRPVEDALAGVGLPLEQAGVWNAVLYSEGDEYASHVDCKLESSRTVTAIVYLTDVEGGETYFSVADKRVQPRCGRLLLFRDADADGGCDPRTQHESLRVLRGEKRILQRWYYRDVTGRRGRSLQGAAPDVKGLKPFQSFMYCYVDNGELRKCREIPAPDDLSLVKRPK